MIPTRRPEGERVPVASFARRRRLHMRRRFASGVDTIVTTGTRAESLAMVVTNLPPSFRQMARFATVARW